MSMFDTLREMLQQLMRQAFRPYHFIGRVLKMSAKVIC